MRTLGRIVRYLLIVAFIALLAGIVMVGWRLIQTRVPQKEQEQTTTGEGSEPEEEGGVFVPEPAQEQNQIIPITRDSEIVEVKKVSRKGTFQPEWPGGTDQTSVGYSNPEEYPDGRTWMTRSPVNDKEVLAFVAKCISVNDGEQICHEDDEGALVGLIVGSEEGEYPVKLWDAELKTLQIPQSEWDAYIIELAEFISANKNGAAVIVLGQ